MITELAPGVGVRTEKQKYNVCVAGGGVAGITLAISLGKQGQRVLLLEGGQREITEESQEIYKGRVVAHEYPDLNVVRLRALGGTSNHWGGWCRPLDKSDFEGINDPTLAWPIQRKELDSYLSKACGILNIPLFGPDTVLDGSRKTLREVQWRFSEPPVNFAEKYGPQLEESPNVDLLLGANLVDIRLNPATGSVDGFAFRGIGAGTNHWAIADYYVLALGGIENARLLLNCNKQQSGGIGNATDQVGRFFMEHPSFDVGCYVLTKSHPFEL